MNPIKVDNDIYYEFGAEMPQEVSLLFGKIIGKAIFENVPIGPRLSRFILKGMTSRDFELSDMKTHDLGMFSSMEYIFKNNFDPSDLGLTFGYIEGSNFAYKYQDEPITNKNKEMFLEMFLNYFGYQKSSESINEFLKGLYSVIPQKLLSLLEIEDLEKLLVGQPLINLTDWKANTVYVNKKFANEHLILWYWEYISTLSQEQLRKWLQFCTGGQSVPLEGFSSLTNNRQEKSPFTIKLINVRKGMIRAHTGFNRIEMPMFSTKLDLEESIGHILKQEEFVFDFE